MTNHETAVPTETDRLHAEILEGRAQISELRDLLRTENQRANAAIERETTAEQAAIEAEEQVRRLGLMVDEYGAGASALTDKLWRVRELHRKTCLVARSDVPPTAFTCGLCEVLDAPAAVSVPPPAPRADDRAAALADEAALIELHCPDHGPQDQDGVWMDCHCAVADDMRKRATKTQSAASGPCVAGEQNETPEAEPGCAHCGKNILRISGTLAEWWVHDPGGHTICFPEQAASSPRATPKPAAGVRQDGAQQ